MGFQFLTKSSSATNFPRSAPDVNFRIYEWKDKCFIFCSLRYSSSHGSIGEQCTQQPFELCRHNFGSRLRCKRPSVLDKTISTSSSFNSVVVNFLLVDALDKVFDDDANDDIELLELLVLGCGGKASTICKS